jgi:hypothetical protein
MGKQESVFRNIVFIIPRSAHQTPERGKIAGEMKI